MLMTRWNLSIPEETDRSVRSYLARHGGKKGDLSKFVTQAVRREIFRGTVKEIKDQNADVDPQEIESIVDDAVAWSRENRP